MSSGMQYYAATLLVFLGVDIMACWALNLQFGVTGVLNFAFIVFQAIGAYVAAVLTLGPDTANGGFQQYILGMSLPFPLPIIAGGVAGALLSIPVGLVALRRLRADYQAVALLAVSLIATNVANNDSGLFNGASGLSLVPSPLQSTLGLSPLGYQWFYVGFTALMCVIVYWFIHRITSSPMGRTLRAVRDNEYSAAALGKNVLGFRLFVLVVGGAIAGISGAVFVGFLTVWSPGAWNYAETFVYLAAVIVGGTGNNLGVVVGALLVPVVFGEATRFMPNFGPTGMTDALQWVVIGILILLFLWFRPQGVVPERRRRFPYTFKVARAWYTAIRLPRAPAEDNA